MIEVEKLIKAWESENLEFKENFSEEIFIKKIS